MKIKIIAILVLMGLSFVASASNPFNEYLLQAQADVNEIAISEFKSTDMNLISSFIEEAQFRFNSSSPAHSIDINKNALSYELRFKPKAWGQRDAENEIIQLRTQQLDIVYSQLLNSALQKRYLTLLDYFELSHQFKYQKERSTILNQETELLQTEVINEEFEPEKLLDTEETLKLTRDRAQLTRKRMHSIATQLGLTNNTNKYRNQIAWVINASEISEAIASYDVDQFTPPEIRAARLKLQLSQSENQLQEAKQLLGINLVKFEYGDREIDEMAFQVGINIPLGTSFSNKETQYNLHSAKSQLNISTLKTTQTLDDIKNQIDWLSDEWQLIQLQRNRIQIHLQKDYAQTNPFLLLNLRKELIAHKHKQAEINQKALALYLNYLDQSGLLSQPPLRNWFQQGAPQLIVN